MVSMVDMFKLDKMRKDIGFILKKNLLLFVLFDKESDFMYEEIVQKALERIRQNATPERMTASILEHILFKGNEELVFTENIIIALEKQVLKLEHADDISSEITALRTRVSTLKNFYDQMIDVGEILQENTNDIFRDEELRFLKNFTTKAERMKERSQGLNDNLIHIWEVLDASMNNKLNDTMKVLTIISIIFQPLTMITGWYGMNFKYMWELDWKYGYLFVIILNILIVTVISCIFKKKKLL
jgi:magnesium transporter